VVKLVVGPSTVSKSLVVSVVIVVVVTPLGSSVAVVVTVASVYTVEVAVGCST
jgi:hypothetical protein